jgi:hypothetical protein
MTVASQFDEVTSLASFVLKLIMQSVSDFLVMFVEEVDGNSVVGGLEQTPRYLATCLVPSGLRSCSLVEAMPPTMLVATKSLLEIVLVFIALIQSTPP